MTTTDEKIEEFVRLRMEELNREASDGTSLEDMLSTTVRELAESAAEVDRLRAHNAALVEAAEGAAKVFDGYVAHHAAKSRTWTAVARAHNDAVMWQSAEESNDKADDNAAHASRLRVAIAKVTP